MTLFLKLSSLLIIFIVTWIAGFYPFFKKSKSKTVIQFPIGESLAAGVFLGAGLIHMLGDASQGFNQLHYNYPIAFLIAGCVFLLFLLLEHIGREFHQRSDTNNNAFAILATVMLSIHSLLMGAALGLGDSFSLIFIVLLAILAHKWAASFALATQINKSNLSFKAGILLFFIFSLMVPIGIVLGSIVTTSLGHYPIIEPIFSALAAGTFLYLGTLHGLEQAALIKQCCTLKNYYYVILGFGIMAVVAIWT
jgi:zinc transporter ZupT